MIKSQKPQSPTPTPIEISPANETRQTLTTLTQTEIDEIELTSEEQEAYEEGLVTWDQAKQWRFWVRREWIWWYILAILVIAIVALMAIFHHSIIDWLTPFVDKLRDIKDGWLIPVAIIFVLSFPPLFGNEIVMILTGVVWGLGKGFAIVAVGIILGELANYTLFRTLCLNRAHKLARRNLNYACLSKAIEEGGFLMAWVVRLSVVPTHISTVVLAVCGLHFFAFLCALILGLPKQLIAVFVGVTLADESSSKKSKIISDTVFGVTVIITIAALWYIHRGMMRVRKRVLLEMRDDLARHGVTEPELPEDVE